LFKALDIGPDGFIEESLERFGEGGRKGVCFSENEVFDFFGTELSIALQDPEGEHRGDDEFVLLEKASAGEVE